MNNICRDITNLLTSTDTLTMSIRVVIWMGYQYFFMTYLYQRFPRWFTTK